MPPDPHDATAEHLTLDVAVDPTDLADWIDAEPVPALRTYRDELAALAEDGLAGTEPVTDHLITVISALEEVGESLRDEDVLPSSLAAVFARCAADIEGAHALVAETQSRIAAAAAETAVASEATRERVRLARAEATRRDRLGFH